MSRRTCFRSCACFTGAHPTYFFGGIPRAGGGTFCRGKGANRGMPLHQRWLPLASMMRYGGPLRDSLKPGQNPSHRGRGHPRPAWHCRAWRGGLAGGQARGPTRRRRPWHTARASSICAGMGGKTACALSDNYWTLPDLQCAWLLLLMCASPRANHAIRTSPPSESVAYARTHDDAIWATLRDCLGGVGEEDASHARGIASLLAALGGLGLRSAERTAPAAYWAAWADALVPLRDRLPEWADRYTELLDAGGGHATCLQEAAEARQTLQGEGWTECPTWRAVLEGQGAPAAGETSAG